MEISGEATLLKIYLSSTDRFKHSPLYEIIVFAAKRSGISGVTVLRGIMAFGASSEVSSSRFWELTEKLPVVIEIVDESEKIDRFFKQIKSYLDKAGKGCLVTRQKVDVPLYKKGSKK